MFKKIKKFFEDYGNLWKACGQFYKKHWFGIIVLETILCGGTYAGLSMYEKKKQKKLDTILNNTDKEDLFEELVNEEEL